MCAICLKCGQMEYALNWPLSLFHFTGLAIQHSLQCITCINQELTITFKCLIFVFTSSQQVYWNNINREGCSTSVFICAMKHIHTVRFGVRKIYVWAKNIIYLVSLPTFIQPFFSFINLPLAFILIILVHTYAHTPKSVIQSVYA